MRSREDATELTTGVDGRDGILTGGICGDSTGSGSGSRSLLALLVLNHDSSKSQRLAVQRHMHAALLPSTRLTSNNHSLPAIILA